ncbi:hypothetical protein IHE45_06G095200 [Dioscorea alata]|uniref:Uncharacterized protein n=2 Tax=Dioscorea alata TaxID=55571 RepID=A0ACB7V5M4_DIOAL|nr:hypothetical protein IHE45_11G030000 [Dioscorea alata]KAH7679997.1 hypothetical protein IHE45_06G095200 [Dioscorea alata]
MVWLLLILDDDEHILSIKIIGEHFEVILIRGSLG